MDIGDAVADFTATTDRGETVRLTDLLAKGPVVLFFYPKAFTRGCTTQACHFRDLAGEFAEVGASPVGISGDDVATQRRFAQEHEFDFPLLADPDGTIATLFGTKRLGPLPPRRQTFVIDTDATILAAIRSELDMQAHADDALAVLRDRA